MVAGREADQHGACPVKKDARIEAKLVSVRGSERC